MIQAESRGPKTFLFCLTVLLLLCGCHGSDDRIVEPAQELPDYFLDRPGLTDWSLWASVYDHGAPVKHRKLGGFGAGNGHTFSMLATSVPFTTMHNLTGPHYQKHWKFFSDKTFTLKADGVPVAWDLEQCFRIRGTAVFVTRLASAALSLWLVDFAPRGEGIVGGEGIDGGEGIVGGEGIDGTAASQTFVRMLVVYNRGCAVARGLSLSVETTVGEASEGLITEIIGDDLRILAAGFAGSTGPVEADGRRLVLDIGTIAPGEQAAAEFLFAFARCGEDPKAIFDAAAGLDPDEMLEATLAWWKDFTGDGAAVVTSDDRFNDLIEGLSVTIAAQQAATGGTAQMSEYSGTWLRDIMGPARFYPLVGRNGDYRRMLDYYWLAALDKGNIANSMDIDIELESLPPEPDWESLPTFSGRESAESPSYLVLHYKAWLDATSDWTPVEERYGMLRHALIHQDIRDNCLLPFSDDETFRIAMAASFGHSLFNEYQKTHLSANSSFLFVAAAEFMIGVAEHMGFAGHAEEYAQMAQGVRDCTEEHYWLEDLGFYAPLIDIDTLEPVARPFEDVNTKPIWTGYLDPDDPQAQANVLNTLDALDSEGGLFYSPVHPAYNLLARLLAFEKGVVTGMTYGYQLDNLAAMDHPMAEATFLMYRDFFHDTGNVSEGQVVDDFGRVSYLYEPFGYLCDLTARYRTWEGGINGAAMIRYLFGLELDARSGRVAIAPHLPAGWDFSRMEGARLGEAKFDIAVEDDGLVRRVRVENATRAIRVDAVVSVEGGIAGITVNGKAAEPEIETRWGRVRAHLPGLGVDVGTPLIIEITRSFAL